jgi:hypothetical protein
LREIKIMLKLTPLSEIDKSIEKQVINLFALNEQETGTLEGVCIKNMFKKIDFKTASKMLSEAMGINTDVILLDNQPIGLCSTIKRGLEIKGLDKPIEYLLLDNISIVKQHRGKGVATRIIKHIAKKHDFFAISRPIQSSLSFWEKMMDRLFNEKITNSKYKIHPLSDKLAGYECIAGVPVVVFDDNGEPIIGIKNHFTLDQELKILATFM